MTSDPTPTGLWPGPRSRHGGVDEVPLPGVPGRLWLAGKHFVGPDPEAALVAAGANVIVCLNEAHELADRYPSYVAWLPVNVGDRAVWHPIPDLHAPTPERARALLDDLEGRLRRGDGLLVHCGAGIGRAGTVAAGLLLRLGVPLEVALATVARHRPTAGPEAGSQHALLEALALD
jgi:protein-tyrosine phosphatase